MMKSALIENGIVTNIAVGAAENHVECGNEVRIGWLYDGASFSAPPPPQLTFDEAVARLSNRFKKARDSGTEVDFGDGHLVPISTTHDAQQELSALAKRLEGGGTQRAATRSGVVIEWTGPMATAAVSAIEDHVSACYTNDAGLLVAIMTAADPATVDIDIGWP